MYVCIYVYKRLVCIRRKCKWQVACSMVSHEKALHNYFIPYLNLRKTYRNFGKSSEISANFQKLRKRFKPVFEELKWFMKLSENFGNSSKVIFRCFDDFLKLLENLRKSSEVNEIIRNDFQMWSEMFVMARRSWRVSELSFEKSSNGPQ